MVRRLDLTLTLITSHVLGLQLKLPRTRLQCRSYHRSVACNLNRFLFSHAEVNAKQDSPEVVLSKDDYRTIHASKVLGVRNGSFIRAGVVSCDVHNGLLTDEAVVEWIPEGKVKKAEPLGNGDPPGSLKIQLLSLSPPPEEARVAGVSLILAIPRPLQLGRLLPMISQMGVDHLVLTEARKVPKDYFGSHLFRRPEELTERLIEGLCQSGDVKLPQVHIVRNLSHFLDHELNRLFPTDQYARVIAHPERRGKTSDKPKRMRHVKLPAGSQSHLVIAVGPEGGWEEPDEIDRFVQCHAFQQITMGTRVLRSDCAVVSLLSLAHDFRADLVQV